MHTPATPPRALVAVAIAAEHARAARAELEATVRAAYADGLSIRAIAAATSGTLSKTRVHQLLLIGDPAA